MKLAPRVVEGKHLLDGRSFNPNAHYFEAKGSYDVYVWVNGICVNFRLRKRQKKAEMGK